MMVALLLYSYSQGVRSSRKIEALCEVDVTYRVIAANAVPDHGTIARFRARHEKALAGLFTQGLALCARAGLAKVGVIALDGTKIAASASMAANATAAQIDAELRATAEQMLSDAAKTDAAEDALFGDRRGDELPQELVDPRSRRARLKKAAEELQRDRDERRAQEEAEEAKKIPGRIRRATRQRTARSTRSKKTHSVARAKADLKVAKAQARALRKRRRALERQATAVGRKLGGKTPDFTPRVTEAEQRVAEAEAKEAAEAATAVMNTTDPDSKPMSTRQGFVQGYNAQATANEQGIVLAAEVTNEASDAQLFVPMVEATKANLKEAGVAGRIGVVLADAGFASEANLKARWTQARYCHHPKLEAAQAHPGRGLQAGSAPGGSHPDRGHGAPVDDPRRCRSLRQARQDHRADLRPDQRTPRLSPLQSPGAQGCGRRVEANGHGPQPLEVALPPGKVGDCRRLGQFDGAGSASAPLSRLKASSSCVFAGLHTSPPPPGEVRGHSATGSKAMERRRTSRWRCGWPAPWLDRRARHLLNRPSAARIAKFLKGRDQG